MNIFNILNTVFNLILNFIQKVNQTFQEDGEFQKSFVTKQYLFEMINDILFTYHSHLYFIKHNHPYSEFKGFP